MLLPLVFLAGAGLVVGQSASDKSITLRLNAASAPTIVAQLSKATGIPMETSAVMGKTVLLLDVHAQPLSEVMKRIAAAAGGSWKHESNLYRLVRDSGQQRKLEQAERAHRSEEIAAEIATSKEARDAEYTNQSVKELAQQLTKMREKNPQYAFAPYGELKGPLNQTPIRRALFRLVAMLDVTELAMMMPGDRIAYSNKPTATERLLNAQVETVLSKFAQEQNMWADAVNATAASTQDRSRSRFGGDPLDSVETVPQSPERLLLIASRSNSSAPVNFKLFIIANGISVADGDLWLGSEGLRNANKSLMARAGQGAIPVELSKDSREIVEATRGWGQPSAKPGPGPSARAIDLVMHPEKADPLGFVATDILLATAKARTENLVAALPDELIGFNFMANVTGQSVDNLLQMATVFGDMHVEESGGWVTVTTYRPYSAEFERVDRAVLSRYLQRIIREGRASLDAEAEYAYNAQPTDYDTIGVPMGSIVDPNSTQNVDQDWLTLRLWGVLTPDQKKALIGGQKIAFKDLTDAQFEVVQRKAFHGPMRGIGSGESFSDILRRQEPTECFPDGLSRDGFLSVTAVNSPAILASSTERDIRMSYVRIFDLASLGNALAYDRDNTEGFRPHFDRFQHIQRVNYTFTYQFAPKLSEKTTLHDVVVPPNSQPIPFDQLPEEEKKTINAQIELTKNQIRDNGKTVKPPLR